MTVNEGSGDHTAPTLLEKGGRKCNDKQGARGPILYNALHHILSIFFIKGACCCHLMKCPPYRRTSLINSVTSGNVSRIKRAVPHNFCSTPEDKMHYKLKLNFKIPKVLLSRLYRHVIA